MQARETYMTSAQQVKIQSVEKAQKRRIPRQHDLMREITGVARPGKTAADKASGAEARRLANRAARRSWQEQPEKNRRNADFPRDACNGKKNRYLVN